MILPETAAERLLVTDGRVRGVRTGDKGRGRNGEPLPNFEPGSDITGRVTVLAEGTQGHLTGVAIERFGLQGDSPQVWALGVKEVWKVAKPLDRVIHTMGWPLRGGKRFREFGGSFIYPMGDDMVTLGMVVGPRLPRRRAVRPRRAAGAEDAQARAQDPRRRRARAVGREDDPRGRPAGRAQAPARERPAALRRRRGPRQRAGAEGHPLRGRVRAARGGGGVCGAPAGRDPGPVAGPLRRRSCGRASCGRTSGRCATCAPPSAAASGWAARWPVR